jgi:hypothetical protein
MPAKVELRQITPADVIESTASVWRSVIGRQDFPDGMCGRHAVRALVAAQVSSERNAELIYVNEDLPLNMKFSWA